MEGSGMTKAIWVNVITSIPPLIIQMIQADFKLKLLVQKRFKKKDAYHWLRKDKHRPQEYESRQAVPISV